MGFQKNKRIIFEDQLLAAQDRGEKQISNPNFAFRKRYSSLYKNFKPDKWYWILLILARKLGICFTALLFRRDPVFQLAFACAIIFGAFTMQLLHRPYMGMEQKAQEVTARALRESAKHFVNYNKVESFFMICSIVVCLSGIMFASGYFNMEYLQSQRRILGVTNMT